MTCSTVQGIGLGLNVTWTEVGPVGASPVSQEPGCFSSLTQFEEPPNTEDGLPAGVAITDALTPTGNWAEQVPSGWGTVPAGVSGFSFVQTIPAGTVVTSPVPFPANVILSVHVPVAVDDAGASADAPTTTSTQTTRNTRKTVIVSSLPF
jgi:hypothetical protein